MKIFLALIVQYELLIIPCVACIVAEPIGSIIDPVYFCSDANLNPDPELFKFNSISFSLIMFCF
jgi:hypothetical protein